MATGRDEWEDDGDALYGEGRSEDLRPPRRPGGQPAQGQDRMGGGQTPPRDDYRSARREPSFGSQGSAPQGQYIGGSQMAGSAMSSPPGNAGNNPRQADDWDEVDPYENLTDRGGPTAPPRRGGKKRRRLLPILLALLFLCAFGAIAWYGYNWGLSGGDDGPIPLVTAERSDIKDEPEDGQEGGTQAPYQDLEVLNNQGGDNGPESILPGPEEPAPVPSAPEVPPAPAVTEPSTQTFGQNAADSTAESVASDNGLPPPPPPPSAEEVMEQPVAEPAPMPEPAPEPAPAPEVAAPPPAPAPAATQIANVPEGSVVIQLAAVRSAEAANSEWAGMQADHQSLLGDMPLLMQEIEIEGRGTFFRIQTGPFPNRATAQDICAQLKAAGQDCIVKTR